MEFAKLNAPTLKELFVTEMESMILSGKLKVGERLPPERELAEQMQVSRAVINGGIAELARKGFLDVKPRVGVYVADYRRTGTPETILSIMEYNGGHLRQEEIRSILEIKLVFDQLVIEQAIPLINAEQINNLDKIIKKLHEETVPSEAAKIAFGFYHELTLMGTNTLIPLIYQAFKIPNLSLWEQYANKYGCKALYENAENLFKAIRRKNVRAAQEYTRITLNALINGERDIYNV